MTIPKIEVDDRGQANIVVGGGDAIGPALNAYPSHGEDGDDATNRSIAHRVKASRSVLALVVDDEYIFAGLQGGEIVVS